MYKYNECGWYVGEASAVKGYDDRVVDIAPENKSVSEVVGALRSNWTGYKWVEAPYTIITSEVVQEKPKIKIAKLAFRSRYTTEEKVALELASLDDPSANTSARALSAVLRVYLQDLATAEFIDLNDDLTIQGVHYLEQIGIIKAGRSAEILSNVILEKELPGN